MTYKKFSLIFGLSIWLIATLVFRYTASSFFNIESHVTITLLYIGTIPILYVLSHWVFNKFKLTQNEITQCAVLMSIPGMLLDTFAIKFYPLVFPTFTMEETIVLGSWVIWAYTIVLLIGLFAKTKKIS